MDVPTRSSYVMAIARTQCGRQHDVRAAQPRGHSEPGLGRLPTWAVVLRLAAGSRGALKIVYDLLLLAMFRKVHPPEERPATAPVGPDYSRSSSR